MPTISGRILTLRTSFTDYGEHIRACDFLARLDSDPDYDWRRPKQPPVPQCDATDASPIMLTSNNRALDRLRDVLKSHVNDAAAAIVLCDAAPLAPGTDEDVDPRARLSQFVREHGVAVDPEKLMEMPRSMAERIARELFRGPLLGPPARSDAEAANLASSFLDLFSTNARFFSTLWHSTDSRGGPLRHTGYPFLGTTMELGFLVADPTHVGCLFLGDEN